MKGRPLIKLLTAELARHGIADYRLGRAKKHPRLCFVANGRKHAFTFSPNGWDGPVRLVYLAKLRATLHRAGCSPLPTD
ncbi:hypothetical protein SAMN02982917_5519 [Azospirillum oryzae]|uniref:Uncharacterized protein n=1 Tax=Azospirillum oryzae TaxID=286727 RepID=A0A1X7HCG7_9PROT|nr:hypothetical protein [Azospirillum oryzae]SMF83369.1 hypothetical protein SAMN02982917_5519 [Azospirillum oryzae]